METRAWFVLFPHIGSCLLIFFCFATIYRYSNRVKADVNGLASLNLMILRLTNIDEEEKYSQKLDSGLYTLQLIAIIIGHLWTPEHPHMAARIELLLKQQKLAKKDVRHILQFQVNVTHLTKESTSRD